MPPSPSEIHWVSDPDQIETLVSPVRQSIMDRLEAIGPASVAQLAQSLRKPADALYYHLRQLEQANLIEQVGARKAHRRPEAIYALINRHWHIKYQPGNYQNMNALTRLTDAMLRQAGRDFRQGFDSSHAVVEGSKRNLWSLRLEAALSEKEQAEVNNHLNAILDILRQAKSDNTSDAPLVALSWVVAPISD